MENFCNAHDCDNVIKGRRADARYCSNYCSEKEKRHRKLNGSARISARSPRSMPITGNIMNDISANAASALLSPSVSNPMSAMGNNALMTCIPHALQALKKHPFLSLAFGVVGYWGANKFFKNCTTTVTIEDEKERISKSCTKATGLQKSGSAAILVIGGSMLMDMIKPIISDSLNTWGNTGGVTRGDTRGNTQLNTTYKGRAVEFSAS